MAASASALPADAAAPADHAPLAVVPPEDMDSESSTEYVPLADRGFKRLTPEGLEDEVQPNMLEKRCRRHGREAAANRVRALGQRVLERFGQEGVDILWDATEPIDS